MILETKQDKSKGCQMTNAIQFADFVLLKNGKQTFKLVLESEGFVLYSEQAENQWVKLTKSNDALLGHLKQREQDHTQQIEQFQNRIALEQSKTANLVSLMKLIQEQVVKHTNQLKELSLQVEQNSQSLDACAKKAQQVITEHISQQEEQNSPAITIIETFMAEVQQDAEPVSSIQSGNQSEEPKQTQLVVEQLSEEIPSNVDNTYNTEESKEMPVVQQQNPVQVQAPVQKVSTPINKTFAIKASPAGQNYVVLQCKETFNVEHLPSTITCRHIRQFFDLSVVNMDLEQRQLMVQPDSKLNNKQSIYVLEYK